MCKILAHFFNKKTKRGADGPTSFLRRTIRKEFPKRDLIKKKGKRAQTSNVMSAEQSQFSFECSVEEGRQQSIEFGRTLVLFLQGSPPFLQITEISDDSFLLMERWNWNGEMTDVFQIHMWMHCSLGCSDSLLSDYWTVQNTQQEFVINNIGICPHENSTLAEVENSVRWNHAGVAKESSRL